MEGNVIGFIIWCMVGLMFLGMAVYAWFSKKPKPMGFWANAKMFEVTDVRKYNRALAKLFGVFGIVFVALGIPLLAGENSAWTMIPILGCMVEAIAVMGVYTLVIERKYKKGNQ